MSVLKLLTKLWLRKYKKKKMIPSVRAVFLGDGVSTSIILDGVYEKFELEALQNEVFPHLREGSNCFDIGANIGNHTSVFAKSFSTVYAFEPNPPIRYVLQANTYGKNVEVIDHGLSNAEGTIYFAQNFENLGASRIVQAESEADFSIAIRTLDQVVNERGITNVSFVKIDVEGHEAQVLQGGAKFFTEHKPIIALEAFFRSNPEEAEKVLSVLRDFGYLHFYTLEAKSKICRLLVSLRGPKLTKMITSLLPSRISKALVVAKVEDPLLYDHQLLICSQRLLTP